MAINAGVSAASTIFPNNTFDLLTDQERNDLFVQDEIRVRQVGGDGDQNPYTRVHIDTGRVINGVYTPRGAHMGTQFPSNLTYIDQLESGEATFISEISNVRSTNPGDYAFIAGGQAENLGLNLRAAWHASPPVVGRRYILVGGLGFNLNHPVMPLLRQARTARLTLSKRQAEARTRRLFNERLSFDVSPPDHHPGFNPGPRPPGPPPGGGGIGIGVR